MSSPKLKSHSSIRYFFSGLSLFLLFFTIIWNASASATTWKIEGAGRAQLFWQWKEAVTSYQNTKYQQVKDIPTNLFGTNAENYAIRSLSSVINGLESTKKILNSQYANCDLSDDNISSILFFSNTGFSKELRRALPESKYPTRKEYEKTCEKLTSCIEGKADTNLNKACDDLINTTYAFWQLTEGNQLTIEESNLGKDRYQNGNSEDSAYDLLEDIRQIGTIFFQETKEAPETVFYRLPDFKVWLPQKSKAWSSSKKGNDSTPSQWANWSPQNQHSSPVSSNNAASANSARSLSRLRQGSDEESPSDDILPLSEDSIINAFIKANDPIKTVSEQGNVAFVNHCTISGSPLIKQAEQAAHQLENNTKSTSSSKQQSSSTASSPTQVLPSANALMLSPQEINSYITDILRNSNSIKSAVSPTLRRGEAENNTTSLVASSDSAIIADVKKQLESCSNKCDELWWDERAVCKLKCLCSDYSSKNTPENTKFHFLEEGAFKLRFCTVPSKITLANSNVKVVYSIEEILGEIQKAINGLYDSGELTTKTRNKEFLNTSQSKFKFWEHISFVAGVGRKAPTTTTYQKQLQKTEQELNKSTKDSMVPDSDERNRYLLLEDYTITKRERSIEKPEVGLPKSADQVLSTEALESQKKYASINFLVSNFLDQNAILLINLNQTLLEMNEALNYLLQKK